MPTVIERELRTETMAPTGEAVAHYEDNGERRAVLVRGGAPNELVRVRFDPSQRPGRGDIIAILEPSPSRVAAPCAHVDVCGGCDWMHLSNESRAEQHRALAAPIARGAPITFHAASRTLGYRTRARFHAKGGRIGYFGARSHALVRVDACVVLDPRIDQARAALEPIFSGARGDGEIGIALGTRGPVADVRWSGELPPAVFGRLEKSVANGGFQGFRVVCGDARRPAIFGDPTPSVSGPDGSALELSPGGFSQAHEEVNAVLAQRVAELSRNAKRILELYAGAGNLTVVLASIEGADVRAVESNEAACDAARKNLGARKLSARSAKITCADAATFDIPPNTDTIVLDPPRTGAREACERIAKTRSVKRVIYVSCDRGTLARDTDILASVFAPTTVDVFEMFPQTSHAETVVLFERKK